MNGETTVASFRAELVQVAGLEPDEFVDSDPRLIEDLDLDSLALAESLVLMEACFGLKSDLSEFLSRDWRGVTVSALFEELCRAADSRRP